MSFLTLAGANIPIGDGSAKLEVNEIGYYGKAIDGTMIGTRRAIKRAWKATTIPLNPVDALVVKNILLGLGHHWSFDPPASYLFSDKGLAATGGNLTYNTTSPTPKFGAGCALISSGLQEQFPLALVNYAGTFSPQTFTYVVWNWNGSTWDGYAGVVVNFLAGNVYKNGTLLAASGFPGFCTLDASGNFNLFGKTYAGAAANAYFDDLVLLPYAARASDLATWSSASAAFSQLPQLYALGDIFEAPLPAAVYGTIGSVTPIQFTDGTTFYDNGQIIEMTLEEV